MHAATADGGRLGDADTAPFQPPPQDALTRDFGPDDLRDLRALVIEEGERAGLERNRVEDLALAVHELAANSIVHADGGGTLNTWREEDALVCEMLDDGDVIDPHAGMAAPGIEASHGRGLWMVKHLCDLVQIRSLPTGNTVRVRMDLQTS